ncbi:MAG TPA: hypothetical protein VD859_05550 [Nocardioides sp.]|nr:hypothetical protein [Nocardioides sp.]
MIDRMNELRVRQEIGERVRKASQRRLEARAHPKSRGRRNGTEPQY